jgi:hypothetical protein
MPSPTKEGEIDVFGIERGEVSCERVQKLLAKRPWVTGKIEKTVQFDEEDAMGIDMFVQVDERLINMLCLEQDPRGLKIQVKSERGKENCFYHKHEEMILNLGTGENIFVFNGQERYSLMLATLVGQMVLMAGLTGTISEEVMLDFLAEEMQDKKAVLAYIKHKDYVLEKKWLTRWVRENSDIWDEIETPELLILGD